MTNGIAETIIVGAVCIGIVIYLTVGFVRYVRAENRRDRESGIR